MKWIKHDTDANQDAKLQNVLLDYGLEGYGLYWYCIELIAGKIDKDNITFELEHDARIIARNTGSTPQKIEEMMRYFVKLGLFENTGGVVTCLKLARRLDKSMTNSGPMRELIGKIRNSDNVMTSPANVMLEENREDEIEEIIDMPPDDGEAEKIKELKSKVFETWWKLWLKGKSKVKRGTGAKTKDGIKPFNSHFPDKDVLKIGEEAFRADMNKMCAFTVKVFDSIAAGEKRYENYQSMFPGLFFDKGEWRE